MGEWCRQWSNYQKISKGAHTIVNANEAMLLITGGSRTSESGGQIFSEIFFKDFLGPFLKIFLHFPPKMFIYSPKISDDLFFVFFRRGAKAAPFDPLDFLQIGGRSEKYGGRGLPWLYGNPSTGCRVIL